MDPGSTPTQPVDDANPSPLTIVDPNPVPVDVPAGPPQPPAKDDNVATTEPTDSEEATATPDAATISDPDQTASPVVPGAFSSGPPESQAPTTLSSNAPASSSSSSPLTRSPSSPDPAATANASLLSVSPEQGQVSPAEGAPQERRPIYKKKRSHPPKGILKPAPPPQKGFSFRRDILQNINTRLAQQGVNVQVPVPPSGTAQATASYIGGMFRKIGGMAAGAAANVGGTGNGPVANFLTGARDPLNGPTSPLVLSLNPADPRTQGVQRQGSTASFASDTTASSVMTAKTTSSTVSKATISAAPLKKVQFQVSHMKVTYPIVGSGTPEDEDLTRMRIEREHRKMLRARKSKKWTPEELEALYRDCCRTREEHPLKKMRLVFQEAAQASPPGLRTMDLSFVPLDRHAVEPIADLLSVDFGLTKLVLENCALTDDSVKSILHALLVSGTLPNLSLASNRKIRFNGWRYIAIFMRRARALRYLDLSENSINKASLEHLLMAIAKSPESVTHPAGEKDKRPSSGVLAGKAAAANDDAMNHEDQDFDEEGEPLMPTAPLLRNVSEEDEPPASAITSLRLENCGLKSSSLEMLSQAVRYSEIRHLSLRRNGINQVGSVSVSMMLKDYPDSLMSDQDTLDQNGSSAYPDARLTSGATSTNNGSWQSAGAPGRAGRTRELNTSSANRQRSYSPSLPEVPVIVSSPGGGITSRRMPGPSGPGSQSNYGSVGRSHGGAETLSIRSPTREIEAGITEADLVAIRRDAQPNQTDEEAIAIYQAKRAKRILADLPRVGNLLTLDLKSNDIRGGVNYIAQVLKKNRTLRVLNLSDNNIEMSGLVAIADALKYNSTLETLDLSHNPCSGPGLEGITTLRTAFTLNSNLKRLFLNDTDLSSEGAIALAEFLPEAKSLIHLDLAENFDIDIAGVMALAVSVRMNKSLRCLDLNIPPNNPDFARLSQEILTSCIRNTELAQQRATQKGLKQPIAAPIYKSVVARAARERDERLKAIQAARAAEEQAALAAAGDKKKAAEELLVAAAECRNVLRDLLAGEEKNQREAPEQKISPPGDFVEDLTRQSKSLGQRLADLATTSEEGSILGKLWLLCSLSII